ncbi:zinc finger protein [Macleaya cordata]|uniref:Zinc finger protein n=1 Tax=Macleaya cordata TaxID=56857 RepID=A0A200R301_MACCD|nr:zinc finger protein [Macleaya cordata]
MDLITEHEPVRVDNITSQSRAGINSSTEILQNRSNRLRFSHNDRLPGDVLLARERLLERLRGVSLTGNRQNIRFSSGISLDEFAYNDDSRHIDAGDWETEAPREWLARGSPLPNSSTLTDILSSSQDSRIKRPPGLNEEEVNCLHQEFSSIEVKFGVVLGVAECSICLERFEEGDGLICLPCGHRFHSACLDPWVRRCGDCPYCRTRIVLAHHKKGSD